MQFSPSPIFQHLLQLENTYFSWRRNSFPQAEVTDDVHTKQTKQYFPLHPANLEYSFTWL